MLLAGRKGRGYRTITQYDKNDRAIATVRHERKYGASGTDVESNPADYVRTFTYTWYSVDGKVLATADYGTNASGDTYTYTSGPGPLDTSTGEPAGAYWTSDPATTDGDGNVTACNVESLGAAVHVSCYGYDGGGRQNRVWHPDGTVTAYEFDGFGRQVLVTENAAATAAKDRQITAYFHECADVGEGQSCAGSRLLKMAAVLPGHSGGAGVTAWSQIDWSATDGSLQVTQFGYGAEVVDKNAATISAHNRPVEYRNDLPGDARSSGAGNNPWPHREHGLARCAMPVRIVLCGRAAVRRASRLTGRCSRDLLARQDRPHLLRRDCHRATPALDGLGFCTPQHHEAFSKLSRPIRAVLLYVLAPAA